MPTAVPALEIASGGSAPCIQAQQKRYSDYSLHDPELSELGCQQCAELQEHLKANEPLAQQVELIVVSPMRRTLQTAVLGLGWLIERGVRVMVMAEWQETSDKPCDTGTPNPSSLLSSLQQTSPSSLSHLVPTIPPSAFDSLDPVYPAKTGKYAFTESAVVGRGQECLEWLRGRKESVIAVVSHSGFLRTAIAHAQFANADYRLFSFAAAHSNELTEWKRTERLGGGMGWSERGRVGIGEGDFPAAEDGWEEEMEEQPGKVAGEVVEEVPR